jgi:hypothetical protein
MELNVIVKFGFFQFRMKLELETRNNRNFLIRDIHLFFKRIGFEMQSFIVIHILNVMHQKLSKNLERTIQMGLKLWLSPAKTQFKLSV